MAKRAKTRVAQTKAKTRSAKDKARAKVKATEMALLRAESHVRRLALAIIAMRADATAKEAARSARRRSREFTRMMRPFTEDEEA